MTTYIYFSFLSLSLTVLSAVVLVAQAQSSDPLSGGADLIIWQAIIAGVVAILLSIVNVTGVVVVAIIQLRTKRELGRGIREVAHNTNSIKDELVAEVRAASFAAGQKEQRDKK